MLWASQNLVSLMFFECTYQYVRLDKKWWMYFMRCNSGYLGVTKYEGWVENGTNWDRDQSFLVSPSFSASLDTTVSSQKNWSMYLMRCKLGTRTPHCWGTDPIKGHTKFGQFDVFWMSLSISMPWHKMVIVPYEV